MRAFQPSGPNLTSDGQNGNSDIGAGLQRRSRLSNVLPYEGAESPPVCGELAKHLRAVVMRFIVSVRHSDSSLDSNEPMYRLNCVCPAASIAG
jgi:hypothetical protein